MNAESVGGNTGNRGGNAGNAGNMRNEVGMRGIWVGLPRIRVEMRGINMEIWEIEVGMREIDTAQKIKLSITHFFSINEIKVCKRLILKDCHNNLNICFIKLEI